MVFLKMYLFHRAGLWLYRKQKIKHSDFFTFLTIIKMTVKELIEKLRKYEDDATVEISVARDDDSGDIKDVWRKGNEETDEDYKIIVISNF